MVQEAADPGSPGADCGCRFVPLEPGHVPELAKAHMACFPGYFLSSLGLPYVRVFYEALARSPMGVAIVAVTDAGRILGFAVGATKSSDFRRHFYRHYFLRSTWALVRGFLQDRDVRRYVLTQRYRITGALSLLFQRRAKRPSAAPAMPEGIDAQAATKAHSLMSLGILPECRGGGLASEVVKAFEAHVAQRGGSGVKVSTSKDNARALGFYQKQGYRVYRDTRPGDVDLIKLFPAGR